VTFDSLIPGTNESRVIPGIATQLGEEREKRSRVVVVVVVVGEGQEEEEEEEEKG